MSLSPTDNNLDSTNLDSTQLQPLPETQENEAIKNTDSVLTQGSAAPQNAMANIFQQITGALQHIWHGTAAYQIVPKSTSKAGLLILGIFAAELALVFSVTIGRGMGLADVASSLMRSFGGLGAPSVYFVIGFGTWLAIFIVLLLAFAAIIALRVGCNRIVFSMRSADTNFSRLASIYAFSVSPTIALMPVILLFVLLPVAALNFLMMPLFMLIFGICGFLAELLTYIGLNREGKFEKSPLVPFVASYLLWIVLTGILMMIVSAIIGGILWSASTSYLGNSMPW
ncbi:DUF6574 domain-containing protein [Arcanobacterium hippocoleae]